MYKITNPHNKTYINYYLTRVLTISLSNRNFLQQRNNFIIKQAPHLPFVLKLIFNFAKHFTTKHCILI